jgi:hypothetical protein
MAIRVWNSFSCNNSSSYRLVARFADAATANDTAAELRMFFVEHAKQMDALMEEGNFPDENPAAAQELAKKYGFKWKDVLTWGDEMLEGDEPSLAAEGEALVIYHTYCGGFGKELPAFLEAKGATEVESEDRSAPSVSVLFKQERGNAELDEELEGMFSQVDEEVQDVEPFKTPWKTRWECYGRAAFFRDAKTVGLYFPIAPTDLPNFKEWLVERGVAKPSIRLCEYADEDKFRAISQARCTACEAALEYLDPRIDDIESEQLACRSCGGMYDLATFIAAAKKQAKADAKLDAKKLAAEPEAKKVVKKPAKAAKAAKAAKKPVKKVAKKPAKKPVKKKVAKKKR